MIQQRACGFGGVAAALPRLQNGIAELGFVVTLRKRTDGADQHGIVAIKCGVAAMQHDVAIPAARLRVLDTLPADEVEDVRLPVGIGPLGRHACLQQRGQPLRVDALFVQHLRGNCDEAQPRRHDLGNLQGTVSTAKGSLGTRRPSSRKGRRAGR